MPKKLLERAAAVALAGSLALSSSGLSNVVYADETEASPKYSVTIEESEGGAFKFQDSEETQLYFAEGEEVTFVSYPDEGYELDMVAAYDAPANFYEMEKTDNTFKMVMPAKR